MDPIHSQCCQRNANLPLKISGPVCQSVCKPVAMRFQANLKRPVIPASFGSKVPSNIRQRYLNLIIDECLKFCPSEEQAYKKVLLFLSLTVSLSVFLCLSPLSLLVHTSCCLSVTFHVSVCLFFSFLFRQDINTSYLS